MEVDLHQLPIPDWDLRCPGCAYPLRGLPSHRCPECGTQFNVPTLVRTWTRLRNPRFTGRELPLPDFGLACPACAAALAAARQFACPQCGMPFDPDALRPRSNWFILDSEICGKLPMPGIVALLAHELVPYAEVGEDALRQVFGTHGITVTRLRVPSEFYFDVLWLLQQARSDVARVRQAEDTGKNPPWRCQQCGERNPGHFAVCWNCQAPGGPAASL